MSTPPRPPLVTAAGVLLVVVGADVLLIALGFMAVLLWVAGGLAFVPCVAAALVVGWIPFYFGGVILSHGIGALRGRILSLQNIAAVYLLLGLFWSGALGLASLVALLQIRSWGWRELNPTAVGAITFVVLHVAAILVAGIFLGRSAGPYEQWVRAKAVPVPPEDRPDSDGDPLPDDQTIR